MFLVREGPLGTLCRGGQISASYVICHHGFWALATYDPLASSGHADGDIDDSCFEGCTQPRGAPDCCFGHFTTGIREKLKSGKKKQHKHKLFGPNFLRTFLTLTPGWPGVKKFLPISGAAGKRTFWCGRPRFSARTSMTRRVLEKLCTKKVCVDFSAL